MKNIFLLLYFIFSFQTYGQENSMSDNSFEHQLANSMYDFVTATLKDNYKINDEQKLYTLFIAEYLIKQQDFKIKVNKSRLRRINKELCQRDNEHFYYFYIDEVNFIKDAYTSNKPKDIYALYPNKPIVVSVSSISKTHPHMVSRYNAHTININNKDNYSSFFNEEEKLHLSAIKIARELMDTWGQVSFEKFAMGIALQNRAFYINTLKDKKEREVIAVIFWKLLCLQIENGEKEPKCFYPYNYLDIN